VFCPRAGWARSIASVLLVAAGLAACAGPTRTGATLDALTRNVGAPKAGYARVIVLRDKDFPGIFDVGWQVRLDGIPMGDLKTGTFVYRDIATGPHQLSFERLGDFSRASTRDLTTGSGRTYFYRLEMNEKGRMVSAMAVGGLTGIFVSSAVSAAVDERGLFDFTPLDEAAARLEIADLHFAD
jgi:hypothetical protein